MDIIRILMLADTHLGVDLPFRPRTQQRRRGPEFFANFERVLEPASNSKVDAVVHGKISAEAMAVFKALAPQKMNFNATLHGCADYRKRYN